MQIDALEHYVHGLDLRAPAKPVLRELARLADLAGGDTCSPSLAELAHATGYSADTVRRTLVQLAADELIERTEQRGGRWSIQVTPGTVPPLAACHPLQPATPCTAPPLPSQPARGTPGRAPGVAGVDTALSSPPTGGGSSSRSRGRAREGDPLQPVWDALEPRLDRRRQRLNKGERVEIGEYLRETGHPVDRVVEALTADQDAVGSPVGFVRHVLGVKLGPGRSGRSVAPSPRFDPEPDEPVVELDPNACDVCGGRGQVSAPGWHGLEHRPCPACGNDADPDPPDEPVVELDPAEAYRGQLDQLLDHTHQEPVVTYDDFDQRPRRGRKR